MIAIPGPSVLFVIGRSLALGRRGGLLSVVGNELGGIPLAAAFALGVGTAVAESIVLFTIIVIAGAACLSCLGIQAIRHRREGFGGDAGLGADSPPSSMRLISEGSLVGVTNPKTIVFFVAALPQFVDLRAGAVPLQMSVLGLEFIVIALISDGIWALAAGSARQYFARSPRRLARVRGTGGVMMIGLGGVLLLSGNKH